MIQRHPAKFKEYEKVGRSVSKLNEDNFLKMALCKKKKEEKNRESIFFQIFLIF